MVFGRRMFLPYVKRCRINRVVILVGLLFVFHLHIQARRKAALLGSVSCLSRLLSPTSTPAERRSVEVHFLTVNAYLTQTSVTSGSKHERLQILLDNLHMFDVVALQELPVLALGPYLSASSALQAAAFLRTSLLPCHTSFMKTIPFGGLLGQTSGVELFSRYPIVAERRGIFSAWNWNEIINNKGWVMADIQISNGCRVRAVSTQLDAGPTQSTRISQIKELVSALTLPGEKRMPVVLLGDIDICSKHKPDCWEYEKIFGELASAGLAEVFPGKVGTWRNFPMDHVFVSTFALDSGLVRVRNKKLHAFKNHSSNLLASDHFALEVGLEIGPCDP